MNNAYINPLSPNSLAAVQTSLQKSYCTQPADSSPLIINTNEVEAMIGQLQEQVNKLYSRLQPFLRPNPKCGPGDTSEKCPEPIEASYIIKLKIFQKALTSISNDIRTIDSDLTI